jgi:glycosyltransferase involved in cell wall biosynthesis
MNVLLINTYYMHGGAGRAAGRLHKALTNLNVDAKLLVQNGFGDKHKMILGPLSSLEKLLALWKPAFETLPLYLYKNRNGLPFSTSFTPDIISRKVDELHPDIVHLHWTCAGFVNINTLKKIKKPIIWTLHDSWPFTGGCHIPLDCKRYVESCGKCPALGSDSEFDLSRLIFRRKVKAWQGIDITVVTPSNWLAKCAKESSLFKKLRIEVIPNGLDLSCIQLIDKKVACSFFGLSSAKKYILFGAVGSTSDRNKGFQYLKPALSSLAEAGFANDYEVIVFGSMDPIDVPEFGLKSHYLGFFHDEVSLNLLYCAADVFVAPSLQENLPNTIMESMACGTPCVAFDVGGVSDLIDHKQNGYLAKPCDAVSLAEGIAWVVEGVDVAYPELSRAARSKITSDFNIEDCARKYLKLYREIVGDVSC